MNLISTPFYSCDNYKVFLHKSCTELPRNKRHPFHKHLLKLTNLEVTIRVAPLVIVPTMDLATNASEKHYCDLCEKERHPNHWFYYCADCDNSLHINCAIGDFPFIKLGSKVRGGGHPQPLTVVKNIWNCPPCKNCKKQLKADNVKNGVQQKWIPKKQGFLDAEKSSKEAFPAANTKQNVQNCTGNVKLVQ
ncbi:hypothetical protein PTKIN_Ptkin17bG0006900 [Pterospermum kingtungense]